MSARLRILYLDKWLAVVDKPAGIEVHAWDGPIQSKARTCLSVLRDQLGQQVFPAHRIDRATAGVLVFTLSSDAASYVQGQFHERTVEKNYFCIARGWLEGDFVVDTPLRNAAGLESAALTRFQSLAHCELDIASGQYEKTRLSLLKANPETGRFHQIRRHLRSLSHPILGDNTHGDKKLNRIFAQDSKRLMLQAHSLSLRHPEDGREMRFRSRWPHDWHRMFELFQYCPLD